jgi:hypothetical protein
MFAKRLHQQGVLWHIQRDGSAVYCQLNLHHRAVSKSKIMVEQRKTRQAILCQAPSDA